MEDVEVAQPEEQKNEAQNLLQDAAHEAEAQESSTGEIPAEQSDSDGLDNIPERFKKRLASLTRQNKLLKERMSQGQGYYTPNVQTAPQNNGVYNQPMQRPDINQFERWQDYVVALEKYQLVTEQAKKQQFEQAQLNAELSKAQKEFNKKIANDRLLYDDFDESAELVGSYLPLPHQLELMKSDMPGAIIKYLEQDINELERLRNLNPIEAAREIGKLDIKLQSMMKNTKIKSSAPKPIGQSKASATVPQSASASRWNIKKVN